MFNCSNPVIWLMLELLWNSIKIKQLKDRSLGSWHTTLSRSGSPIGLTSVEYHINWINGVWTLNSEKRNVYPFFLWYFHHMNPLRSRHRIIQISPVQHYLSSSLSWEEGIDKEDDDNTDKNWRKSNVMLKVYNFYHFCHCQVLVLVIAICNFIRFVANSA